MVTVDTFWIILKGKPVEVFKDSKPGTYRAVNPKDFDGIICRGPDEVFFSKPRTRSS